MLPTQMFFDDDDLIETDTLTTSNNYLGCDNNYFSENIAPTTNDDVFAFEVEEVVQTVTMSHIV